MRGLARLGCIAVAALVVGAGCGPSEPALRLSTDTGSVWTYDAHRQDEWADGFGGVLESRIRFRMTAEDGVPGRAARYATVIESLRVDTPPRFGVTVDTSTAEPEEGDAMGVEDLVRGLLGRRGEVTIASNGSATSVEPDRETREALVAWRKGKDPQASLPVVTLLDELLDGPRVVARWIQAPGMLLPQDAYAGPDATWTRTVPPAATPAGRLACEMHVHRSPGAEGRVVLVGEGDFNLAEPDAKSPVGFQSGTIRAEAELDVARGVFTRYDEVTEFVLVRKDTGETSSARWTRSLKLVE